MLNEIRNWPVNWIDGMKISKNHFLSLEQYLSDHLKDVRGQTLTDFNYGLLPPVPESKSSLNIQILNNGSTFQCVVNECRAITQGGSRIELTNFTIKFFNLAPKLQFGLNNLEGSSFYVIMGISQSSRVPGGPPDPNESPLRHPFISPDYHLEVVPAAEVNAGALGDKFMVIAGIVKKGPEYFIDDRFIPPCSTVNSYPLLMDYFKKWSSFISDIQNNSIRIIQKVLGKQPSSAIADNTKFLVEHLAQVTGLNSFYYRTTVHSLPPVALLNLPIQLASISYYLLNSIIEKEKEEILNYYAEWTDWTPSFFENLIVEVVNLKYDHNDIASSVTRVDNFLTNLVFLLARLASLEFIGKRKEKDIFIREVEKTKLEKEGKKVWKPLDF